MRVLLALALFAGAAAAQSDEPIVLRSFGENHGFVDPEDQTRVVSVHLGGVEVQQGERRLLGRSLVVVLRRGADGAPASAPGTYASERVLELFLDGDVVLEEGDETVVGATSLHVDNTTGTVTILDGRWISALRGQPLVARYDLMRSLADGTREMEGASYSTCEFAHAHWSLDTPWARLEPTPEGRILRTGGNTLRVGSVPLLWLPGVDFNVDRDRPPLRSVGIADSRRFGTELQTAWGGDASGMFRGLADGLDVQGPVEAEWNLQLDNYSSRGVFVEPGWEYRLGSSSGELFGSFINDDNSKDHLDQPIEDDTRGRIDLEHRTRIDEQRVLDVELSYLSDRGYLDEYYEHEAKVGKEQETYVSYRDVEENEALTALARVRLNDFQTQVEYKPQVTHRLAGEPVDTGPFGRAFFTSRSFADSVRLAAGENEPGDPFPEAASQENVRAGSRGELVWPIDVGGDRLQVAMGYDVTAFDDHLAAPDDPTTLVDEQVIDDGSALRHALLGGAAWSRTYSGVGEAQSDLWNFDGVRQVLEPRVEYRSVLELNEPPTELVAIDDTETLDKLHFFRVGVRHRIQTHQDGAVATVLDSDVSVPFFPDEERDNAGTTSGPMLLDTLWTPGADIWGLRESALRWRASVDSTEWEYTKSFLSYSTAIGPDRRFGLAHNKAVHSSNTVQVGLEWVLTPKWRGAVYVAHDLREDENDRAGVLLRQLAHRWIIDVEASQRRGESRVNSGENSDESRISVRFRPAFLDRGESILDTLGTVR